MFKISLLSLNLWHVSDLSSVFKSQNCHCDMLSCRFLRSVPLVVSTDVCFCRLLYFARFGPFSSCALSPTLVVLSLDCGSRHFRHLVTVPHVPHILPSWVWLLFRPICIFHPSVHWPYSAILPVPTHWGFSPVSSPCCDYLYSQCCLDYLWFCGKYPPPGNKRFQYYNPRILYIMI